MTVYIFRLKLMGITIRQLLNASKKSIVLGMIFPPIFLYQNTLKVLA